MKRVPQSTVDCAFRCKSNNRFFHRRNLMAIQDAALQPGNEFKGKVALVTGATRNIGRSIALALAAGGAKVAVNSRVSREAGDKIVQEIKAMGGEAETFVAD